MLYRYQIIECEAPLSEDDISNVQNELNIIFPPSLLQHYRAYNGGRVDEDRDCYIKADTRSDEVNGFSLSNFFPLVVSGRGKETTFAEAYEDFVIKQQVVESKYLPIGYDVSGWPICICMKDEAIYSLQRETLNDSGQEVMLFVCESLTSFVNGMLTRDEFEEAL